MNDCKCTKDFFNSYKKSQEAKFMGVYMVQSTEEQDGWEYRRTGWHARETQVLIKSRRKGISRVNRDNWDNWKRSDEGRRRPPQLPESSKRNWSLTGKKKGKKSAGDEK